MSLNIGDALETAVGRTLTRAGLTLAGAFFVLQLLATLFMTNMSAAGATRVPPSAVTPILLPFGTLVNAVLGLISYLLVVYLGLVVVRSMVSDVTDRVPAAFFTRRIGPAFGWWIVASIVVGILVTIGFVLLVIPGIYLALGLAFVPIYVVVEDETAFTAMQSSWDLATGHRWRLLVALLVPAVVYGVIAGIIGVFLPMATVAGWVLTALLGAVWAVFLQALLAACYRQLRGADDGSDAAETGDGDDDGDAGSPRATVVDA
ncbi:hypothetical protein [Halarchaeum acidiphilum]|nr:hypothetical protein [Halarchaeum acidiphilum]